MFSSSRTGSRRSTVAGAPSFSQDSSRQQSSTPPRSRPAPCFERDDQQFDCFARTNCQTCFNAVYDLHAPLIRQRVAGRFRDADQAEDAFQEIMARLLSAKDRYNSGLPFANWVNRVTTNRMLNFQRDESRKRTVPMSQLPDESFPEIASKARSPQALAEQSDMMDKLRETLRGVGRPFRRSFFLHHIEGLKYPDAAKRVNVNPGTVKTRSYRAARHVEEELGEALREHLLDEIYATSES